MGGPAHQGIGAVDPKSDNGTSVRLLRSQQAIFSRGGCLGVCLGGSSVPIRRASQKKRHHLFLKGIDSTRMEL
jgi:hypothetical protein